ncbi:hypothetical protein MSG28_014018 [Choristoneura fumiferana]|uniref:Uncharacterized protein n=1 Tax=Choristoneura fumiferana TaxID=7141 RepID=A0ACC0JFJ9_CHOFU|nr:hypothetical protein MSG28_014018 [Choristoneura fumiferana]
MDNTSVNGEEHIKLLSQVTEKSKQEHLAMGEAENNGIESEKRFYIDKKTKPLDGITIGVKDNFCTKDIRTSCASNMLKNFIPTYNATVYSRLRNAGACLIGKCNLDEFAMGAGTVDSIFGPTRNPWGYKECWRIAGGSSGGSAVAVSSGACVAAIGSDTGGSTRNPAALCGVVGLKPTYGLVSRHGLVPLVNSMDVPGIMTRKVEDAVNVLNCIAGPDNLDSTTIKRKFNPVTLDNDFDMSKIKIGIPKEYHCPGMSEDIIDTWKLVTNLLENEKASVQTVSMPHTSVSIAVYSILNQCEVASNMARYDGIEYGLRTEEDHSTEELYASSRSKGFNSVVRSRIFAAAVTSEKLAKLSISIDALPQKSQQLLLRAAECQQAMDIVQLNPIAISLQHTRELSEQLEEEYEILKLKQKNEKLQIKIDRNNKFLDGLRSELENSRLSLSNQNPNPENIQEMVRQMRQKVFAYEESCELAKTKFNKLSVPEACFPKSLQLLASTLEALRSEALALQQRAEDITLAREARDLLSAARR